MGLTSCCGILTLQVGVIILSVVFFVVAALVFGVNVFSFKQDENLTWALDLLLVIIFVFLMLLSGALVFLSAYSESRKMANTAMIVIIILTFYWLILTIFSFSNSLRDSRRVCVDDRCPESFWLAPFIYRNFTDNETDENNTKPKPAPGGKKPVPDSNNPAPDNNNPAPDSGPPQPSPAPPDVTGKPSRKKRSLKTFSNLLGFYIPPQDVIAPINLKFFNDKHRFNILNRMRVLRQINIENLQSSETDPEADPKGSPGDGGNENAEKDNLKEEGDYETGLPLLGAFIFALVNLLFFLYAIYLMWSYAQGMRDDQCCEEIVVCSS